MQPKPLCILLRCPRTPSPHPFLQLIPSSTFIRWVSWSSKLRRIQNLSLVLLTALSPSWPWTPLCQRSYGHGGKGIFFFFLNLFSFFFFFFKDFPGRLVSSFFPAADVGSRWLKMLRAVTMSCVQTGTRVCLQPLVLTCWLIWVTTAGPCRPAFSEVQWQRRPSAARSVQPSVILMGSICE